jgi:hypothetical protein
MPNKPAARTIRVDLQAPYEGFYAVIKVDFPARILLELQSGDFGRTMEAFSKLVIDHNLTDEFGNKATSFLDVDPVELANKVIERWGDELGKLPPR